MCHFSVADSVYSIDYWLKDHQIAIELDGPSHFIAPSNKPNGTCKAKRRYLDQVFKGRLYTITGNVAHNEASSIWSVFEQLDLAISEH